MNAGTVLIAGGGTAGHVFPALAVADALRQRGYEARFVGVADRLEARLVPEAGYPLETIEMVPVPRGVSPQLAKLPLALWRSIRRCVELIGTHDAVAVVTFGGYVSFPLSWAARRTGRPLVVHEQNSVPGLANRVAARWADRVAVTFPGSDERFPHPERVAVTGNPVRPSILELDLDARRPAALERFGLDPARRTLLAFGGSQGARRINEALIAAHQHWRHPERLQILHIAGRQLHDEARAAWEEAERDAEGPPVQLIDFTSEMGDAYAVADVVLCRAGATSIAELTALGLASVLVPYPHATGDHQRHNAMALRRVGGARMVLDDGLDGYTLVDAVEPLLEDDELRAEVVVSALAFARRDAADLVADAALELVNAAAERADRERRGTG
jgi:UDP-N-acetylglucosamine--N-acetylmuramyl-(pentapeptide) pyrophosphoryl-undecaprenol N-acetylglucosamine transferase